MWSLRSRREPSQSTPDPGPSSGMKIVLGPSWPVEETSLWSWPVAFCWFAGLPWPPLGLRLVTRGAVR